jgi:predicted nicotinamide N-methyase
MEVGCGWGLAGIYCAKNHAAVVTGVDIDPEVFPYLEMHSRINDVKISTIIKGFGELATEQLKEVDVLIGADICFWDTMVGPLKKLINRSLRQGVQMVVIADPGRPTFNKVADHFCTNGMGESLNWDVTHPHPIQGKILKIGAVHRSGHQKG